MQSFWARLLLKLIHSMSPSHHHACHTLLCNQPTTVFNTARLAAAQHLC